MSGIDEMPEKMKREQRRKEEMKMIMDRLWPVARRRKENAWLERPYEHSQFGEVRNGVIRTRRREPDVGNGRDAEKR